MENYIEILKELKKEYYIYFGYYRTDENSGCSNFLTNKHIYTIVETLLLPFSYNAMADMYILSEWHSSSFLEYYRGEWDDYGDKSRKEAGLQLIAKLNKIIENRYYDIELHLETIIAGNLYNGDTLSYLQSRILSKMYKILEQVYSKINSNNRYIYTSSSNTISSNNSFIDSIFGDTSSSNSSDTSDK